MSIKTNIKLFISAQLVLYSSCGYCYASDSPASDASNTQIEAIKIGLQDKLRDPDSAKFKSIKVINEKDGGGVYIYCGKINAKNGFGGYTGFRTMFGALIPAGKNWVAMPLAIDSDEDDSGTAMCHKRGFSDV